MASWRPGRAGPRRKNAAQGSRQHLQPIPPGETLTGMLTEGKLDAVITARALSSYVEGVPNIGRLFPNYQDVERDYYRRTRIFPPMHLIGIRKNLVESSPVVASERLQGILSG